jgi:hypothetical protein
METHEDPLDAIPLQYITAASDPAEDWMQYNPYALKNSAIIAELDDYIAKAMSRKLPSAPSVSTHHAMDHISRRQQRKAETAELSGDSESVSSHSNHSTSRPKASKSKVSTSSSSNNSASHSASLSTSSVLQQNSTSHSQATMTSPTAVSKKRKTVNPSKVSSSTTSSSASVHVPVVDVDVAPSVPTPVAEAVVSSAAELSVVADSTHHQPRSREESVAVRDQAIDTGRTVRKNKKTETPRILQAPIGIQTDAGGHTSARADTYSSSAQTDVYVSKVEQRVSEIMARINGWSFLQPSSSLPSSSAFVPTTPSVPLTSYSSCSVPLAKQAHSSVDLSSSRNPPVSSNQPQTMTESVAASSAMTTSSLSLSQSHVAPSSMQDAVLPTRPVDTEFVKYSFPDSEVAVTAPQLKAQREPHPAASGEPSLSFAAAAPVHTASFAASSPPATVVREHVPEDTEKDDGLTDIYRRVWKRRFDEQLTAADGIIKQMHEKTCVREYLSQPYELRFGIDLDAPQRPSQYLQQPSSYRHEHEHATKCSSRAAGNTSRHDSSGHRSQRSTQHRSLVESYMNDSDASSVDDSSDDDVRLELPALARRPLKLRSERFLHR